MKTKSLVYNSKQVGVLFGVCSKTVTRWADRGLIPSLRTPSGQRRYPRDAIDDLLRRSIEDADATA